MKTHVSRARALSEICRIAKRDQRVPRAVKPCNLCRKLFSPRGRFHLFCDDCRRGDELFRFHDWLPALT